MNAIKGELCNGSQGNVVGSKVVRVDGYEKVTGKAIYGDDIQLNKMLHAACRFTDIPAGKIKKLDISKAEKMPGVVAVGVYKDVPGAKKVGPIRQDYPPIVDDEISFFGDVLAVVAAETKEQACAAVDAIEAEYETYIPVTNVEEAVKSDSRLVHPEYKSNVVVHYPLIKGDVEKGFAESDQVIERKYHTGFQEHGYIEPETVTVVPDPTTKGFKVYGSIQNPFTTRKVIAMYLGLNLNQVNVMCSVLGGSFGGKDDIINNIGCRAALLSKMTDRPVKLTYTREHSLKESYKRHPYVMTYKVGFNKDGKLKSMKIDILADSGAYSSQSFFVNWRSVVQATGPYEIEHVRTDIKAIYTNNTYTAAFRGFGSPQIIFAQESLMDEIAEICNITPLEIRRLNGFKQGSITASGQKLSEHKVSLMQVIEEATGKCEYEKKQKEFALLNQKSDRYKYGIGFAASYRGCCLGAEGTDMSSAIVSVQADGSVIVITGVNENGQGLRTTFCMVASEVLGVNLERITFLEPQTSTISDGGPTVASRGTLVGGNATIEAANIVKKRIFEVIKDSLKVSDIEETEWKNDLISRKEVMAGVEPIKFSAAAEKAYWAGANLSAYGWFVGPEVGWVEETGQGNAYFTYVYGCQVAEVRVDTHTGKIDVQKITAAHDIGKVLNRLGAEGQVYGGVTQGMGYGTMEDFNIENSVVKSENFDTYLLPTIKDIGEIDPILVENPDKYGPFGAKGMGEPTLELTAPAISNALKNATGIRSYQIPLTLEQVFLGKNLKKPVRASEAAVHDCSHKKQYYRMTNVASKNPANLAETLEMLSTKDYRLLAGGTDVVVQGRLQQEPLKLINIHGLKELQGIKEQGNSIRIGAGVTFTEIVNSALLNDKYPLLIQACVTIGSQQIRNRATLGGNIANCAPCADSIPPLILYGTTVELQSKTGSRTIALDDFITRGYKNITELDEIIVAFNISKPSDKKYYTGYFQLGRRNAVNISRMSMSALITLDSEGKVAECRMADGALFAKPQRLYSSEAILIGKKLTDETIEAAAVPMEAEIEKAIGGRWSAEYKLPVFLNMFKDVLKEVKAKIDG